MLLSHTTFRFEEMYQLLHLLLPSSVEIIFSILYVRKKIYVNILSGLTKINKNLLCH